MGSRLSEFMQSFESPEETKDETKVEEQAPVEEKVEAKPEPVAQPQEAPPAPAPQPEPQPAPKPRFKLNLGSKARDMSVPQGQAREEALTQTPIAPPAPPRKTRKTAEVLEEQRQQDLLHIKEELERLFEISGTDPVFHDQWMSVCLRAREATVKGRLNTKVRNGKFRLTTEGMEILPDMDVHDKSSKEILSMRWDV